MEYHNPVMLEECIEALDINPSGVYVDVTFGGGGHSKRILSDLNDEGRLIVFDQDSDALKQADLDDPKMTFVQSNFRFLKRFLDYHECIPVDGILADLGVSSHQFDDVERGFSFRDPSKKLDMRMNSKQELDAIGVLNYYSESELADVFHFFGELRNSKVLAKAIVSERKSARLITVGDLLSVIEGVVKGMSNKFLAQVFQAIRIEVNGEMQVLKEMLVAAGEVLKPGGRLVVMSYHSLEDRIVKNYLKTGNVQGDIIKDEFGNIFRPFRLVNKKTTAPGASEILVNPRARSAKLRVAEKI
ncbi:16S rRNA (cytosine(1402)-N(4))-methyltransferase RsmH [Saprospiraceae bacterium]|nr:16S rRNA (cytosine(1402)-N(4))-methyltransferase RsmH [Saprospiraceae bacterium]